MRVMSSHNFYPYFDSNHYKETVTITERKLILLGYNQKERVKIHEKMKKIIQDKFNTGNYIYIDGIGLFEKDS